MIKIRCIEESGIISDLIDWKENGRFSHVEFILADGYLGSRLNGGVQIRPFQYCTPVREAILSVALEPEEEETIMAWAHAQIGDAYDWKAVLDVGLNAEVLTPSGLDCSQFTSTAFSKGGLVICRKPFALTTPEDHFNCMRFDLESLSGMPPIIQR